MTHKTITQIQNHCVGTPCSHHAKSKCGGEKILCCLFFDLFAFARCERTLIKLCVGHAKANAKPKISFDVCRLIFDLFRFHCRFRFARMGPFTPYETESKTNTTKIFRSVRITHAGSYSYIVLRFCPKFAQMENSTTITKSDWLFAHHPIPNAKFQPIS